MGLTLRVLNTFTLGLYLEHLSLVLGFNLSSIGPVLERLNH